MADPLGLHPLEPPPNEACQPVAALAPRGSCILDVVAAAAASPASVAFYGGAGEEGLAPLTYGALLEVGERVVQLAVRRLGDGGGGEERQADGRAGCRPAPSRRPTSRLPHCYR